MTEVTIGKGGGRRGRALTRCLLAILWPVVPAVAQDRTTPAIDTEDASLGASRTLTTGRIHPSFGLDVRNGDYARGNYDDDRANLSRLPVHLQIGVAAELTRTGNGRASTWLVLRSSNGFHAPRADERAGPRAWYESNNLAALMTSPAPGLRAGLVYTIKTSPNRVSGTTHEASIAAAYDADDAVGRWRPAFAATTRTRGGAGIYTQVGVRRRLFGGERDLSISVPAAVGIGWGGFYAAGSGNRVYGNVGAAVDRGFRAGGVRWTVRAEALALVRDPRLARLSGPEGETGVVVPLGTVSVSMTY